MITLQWRHSVYFCENAMHSIFSFIFVISIFNVDTNVCLHKSHHSIAYKLFVPTECANPSELNETMLYFTLVDEEDTVNFFNVLF